MHTQFITALEANYERVFNYTGGHPDLRIVALIAAQYTFAGKIYSGVTQQKIIDEMREADGLASLRSFGNSTMLSYKMACYFDFNDRPFQEQVGELEKKEEILAQCGFKKSPYRTASALFIEDTAHGVRAKKLYDAMHKQHPILTRTSDFPLAVLLTLKNEGNIELRAQTMKQYFISLREKGFKMSDFLQALTQLLTLFDVNYREELVHYVVKLQTVLQEQGVKIKRMHYPYIGLLALTATDMEMIKAVTKLEQQLRETKALKQAKELALVFAIQKLVQDYVEAQDAVLTTQFAHWSDLFQFGDFFLYLDPNVPVSIGELFDF